MINGMEIKHVAAIRMVVILPTTRVDITLVIGMNMIELHS